MKGTKKEFDWLQWAGIKENNIDKLHAEAEKYNVPVFETDSTQDIFNRILAVRSYSANKNMVRVNSILTAITFISAVVAVLSLI